MLEAQAASNGQPSPAGDPPSPDPAVSLPLPILLGDALSPVDIWQALEAGQAAFMANDTANDTARADLEWAKLDFHEHREGSNRQLLQALSALPARRWFDLCNGAGWSAMAASALSWCEGARLDDVLHVYRTLNLQPKRGDAIARAASLINPALLPQNRLSALIAAGGDFFGVSVLISARSEAPELDLPPDQLARLNPDIMALITKP